METTSIYKNKPYGKLEPNCELFPKFSNSFSQNEKRTEMFLYIINIRSISNANLASMNSSEFSTHT